MLPAHTRARLDRPCSGALLIETLIAVSLFATVLLSSMALVQSGRRFSYSTLQVTAVEDLSQQMLFRMEHELAAATGANANPFTALTGTLSTSETDSIQVASTLGFPPRGVLVFERGTEREEHVGYSGIADMNHFTGLTRGLQCTQSVAHPASSNQDVLWVGLAEPLENQTDPSADDYDGIASEDGRGVYFRGDGVGFSYQVPVDPTGGNNPLNGHDLNWGAEVNGVGPTLSGWAALVFVPEDAYEESRTHDDINKDGDTVDVFDVGQIRRLTWDSSAPSAVEDLGLGPTNVLQERCHWGGDLNADGFADPIFLWDAESNLLHVRLFLLGRGTEGMPVVREVESVLFLRNEPEL